MLGHMADVERVFAYRLLRAARGDAGTALASFSDDDWAARSPAKEMSLPDLLSDLETVRAGTLALLRPLSPRDWTRTVDLNGVNTSVRAMACIIAGHERHHQQLMQEKYLLT